MVKKAGKSKKAGGELNPVVKSWLDNVIIPALVKEYIEEMQKKNRRAATSDSVTSPLGDSVPQDPKRSEPDKQVKRKKRKQRIES